MNGSTREGSNVRPPGFSPRLSSGQRTPVDRLAVAGRDVDHLGGCARTDDGNGVGYVGVKSNPGNGACDRGAVNGDGLRVADLVGVALTHREDLRSTGGA